MPITAAKASRARTSALCLGSVAKKAPKSAPPKKGAPSAAAKQRSAVLRAAAQQASKSTLSGKARSEMLKAAGKKASVSGKKPPAKKAKKPQPSCGVCNNCLWQ